MDCGADSSEDIIVVLKDSDHSIDINNEEDTVSRFTSGGREDFRTYSSEFGL